MPLQTLLDRLAAPDTSAVKSMVLIVDWLRPSAREPASAASERITGLAAVLESRPALHAELSARLRSWLEEARFFHLFTSLGLYSRRGFLREVAERLYERFNPAPVDMGSVRDVFFLVFHHKSDMDWVEEVPDDMWLGLFLLLWQFTPEDGLRLRDRVALEILNAIELLSIWIAAEGLEPTLIRLDPRMVERDSALVALQRELAVYAQGYPAYLRDEGEDSPDDAHARVLLEQCAEEVARLSRRTVSQGASVAITHLLERLSQTLDRIEHLLDVISPSDPKARAQRSVELFRQLVQAVAARNSVRALWQQNSRMLARSVTENSSGHGEHYIAGNRRDYFRMLGSAAGGGVIIALMALIKLKVLELGLTPALQTALVALNYGLGFVLIHILHGTVATKQPAMTAASIAEKVEQGEKGRANARKLAELLVKVGRTQFVAVLGNVALAVTVAALLGWGYRAWSGLELIDQARYEYIRTGLHPWLSPALLYAGIAGVWLFCSGLIAGFFDNRAAYLNLAERLRGHPLLRRILPQRVRERVAVYIYDNYGALMSNFLFGLLLGYTGYVGYLLGLPIDIRHVAFASAEVGYAAAYGMPGMVEVMRLLCFALMIGGVNLAVSFGLALSVALRARGTRIARPGKLLKAYFQVLRERPAGLLYPPATSADAENSEQPPDSVPDKIKGQDKAQKRAAAGKTAG